MKPYLVALLLVVGILGGFYGGYKTGQNNVSASAASQNQASRTGGQGAFAGGRGGGGFGSACPSPGAASPSPGSNAVASGTVTDLTSTSLTITAAGCDVKIVFGNTVQVSKTVTGSTSDLKDNMTVTIVGTRQADGSIKATTIQIGGARVGARGGASPSPGGG
ncbi:MAG: hypothetical protein AUI15_38620 [Actinobacteria bacterium 13_2_20CM_2_66_6]|nr:MAG: hypothetical protein AUI15_38620 [Actinobacteria bacterium 13_2_20CM_2_66_6]